MKIQLVVALVVVGVFALAQAQDISGLLMDRNYVRRQIDCILERGRCDVIGRRIKTLLPDALNNGCRRCTPSEARIARRLMEFMQTNYPNEWRAIVQRYGNRYYRG
ncbi:ejaculatory bulb-specific protein 3-like [Orussus abietinus]|uniref:ejaculatory bulb-specific protein 3-like n=1 Tax=Orussus abietinus TaxID=222816 RepID=UPI0006266F22|nr:ejaculatory bulb-specific protein 3-like [Orussus abietinus]